MSDDQELPKAVPDEPSMAFMNRHGRRALKALERKKKYPQKLPQHSPQPATKIVVQRTR